MTTRKTENDQDPTALDAIAGAGLTADQIVEAIAKQGAAPTNPLETRLQSAEMRLADLETDAADMLDFKARLVAHFGRDLF